MQSNSLLHVTRDVQGRELLVAFPQLAYAEELWTWGRKRLGPCRP